MSGYSPSPRLLRRELRAEEVERLRRLDCASYTACANEMRDAPGWRCPTSHFCFAPRDDEAEFLEMAQSRPRGD